MSPGEREEREVSDGCTLVVVERGGAGSMHRGAACTTAEDRGWHDRYAWWVDDRSGLGHGSGFDHGRFIHGVGDVGRSWLVHLG
jgi:hypothetical protein